jgi:S-adenosylmethionine:tRNA-ribosyltransferase-isomerase (queuine synthetase)
MTTIHLHDMVALMEDTQAQRFPIGEEILLRRGQVGTVVEELGEGEAFEIEFAQTDGQAYAMLAVQAEKLIPLYYEPIELVAAS